MLELNSLIFEFFAGYRNFPGIGLLADFPIFFLPIFLVSMWLYHTFIQVSQSQRLNLLHIFYGCVLGVILSYCIKLFVEIERPEDYLEISKNLIMSSLPEKSFPSEHANVSFAFLTGLFLYGYKKTAFIFLPFAIIMNVSRIITGVHWPLDIIAGIIVGILSALIFFKYFLQLKFVKQVDSFIIKLLAFIKL